MWGGEKGVFAMPKVGATVILRERPGLRGRVVGRRFRERYVLVLWENRSQSLHFVNALKVLG